MAKIYETAVPDYGTPDADFPDGKIITRTGATTGTKLTAELHQDIVQLFDKLVRDAGITKNDLFDNVTNGYQLLDALVDKIKNTTKQSTVPTDANDLTITAFYEVESGTTANIPVSEDGTLTHVSVGTGSSEATQMYQSSASDAVYFRRKTGGSWVSWVKVGAQADIDTINAAATDFNITNFDANTTVTLSYAKTKQVGEVVTSTAVFDVEFIGATTAAIIISCNVNAVFGDDIRGINNSSQLPGFTFFVTNGSADRFQLRVYYAGGGEYIIGGHTWATGDKIEVCYQGSYIKK